MRATPAEPIAVPISTVRELKWFPDARYRGIEILPATKDRPGSDERYRGAFISGGKTMPEERSKPLFEYGPEEAIQDNLRMIGEMMRILAHVEMWQKIERVLRDGAAPVLAFEDGWFTVGIPFHREFDSSGTTLVDAMARFADKVKTADP